MYSVEPTAIFSMTNVGYVPSFVHKDNPGSQVCSFGGTLQEVRPASFIKKKVKKGKKIRALNNKVRFSQVKKGLKKGVREDEKKSRRGGLK